MFILVLFGMFLSPPTKFIRDFLNISLPVADMPVRATLYIHVVAVIFTAILAFFVVQLFKVDPFIEKFVLNIGTAGYFVTSISAIVYAYFFRHPVPHGVYLFGLSLMFIALLALVYEFFPKIGKKVSLERRTLFVMLLLMTATVIIGAIYGSNRNEELIQTELWQRIKNAHVHTTLVIIPMSLVILITKQFRLTEEGTSLSKKIASFGLGIATIGSVVAVVANYIYIWVGPEAHNIITPASGFVLGGSIIIMILAFKQTMVSQGISLVKMIIKEPLKTGMFWILFWVNIVVAGPGIYVAINLDYYKQPEMARTLEAFEHGHYHMLAFLAALVLLFLIIDFYPIRKSIKHWIGWMGTIGYLMATGATVIYMFTNPDPYNHFALPFIDVGLAMVTLAVLLAYYGYNDMRKNDKKHDEMPNFDKKHQN